MIYKCGWCHDICTPVFDKLGAVFCCDDHAQHYHSYVRLRTYDGSNLP